MRDFDPVYVGLGGLLQCSRKHLYSMTSSARASTVGGTSRPSGGCNCRAISGLDQQVESPSSRRQYLTQGPSGAQASPAPQGDL